VPPNPVNGPRRSLGKVRFNDRSRPSWQVFGGVRILLAVAPIAVILWLINAPALWRFAAAALAIVPLASIMGEATEHLAHRLGPGVGGLLNATFGNAAELIIALFALFRGLDAVVKASITGSIIGNVLLVLGASLFAGGLKYPVQRFNKTAAGVGGTLMVLAAIGMLVPAMFHQIAGAKNGAAEHGLSLTVSAVLIVTYALNLVFSLATHKDLYNPDNETCGEPVHDSWSTRRSMVVLVVATTLVALMSEVLVGAVEAASRSIGMSEVFVGVIIVAIVGNAAEHSTAVLMARKNQMDLAVGIALGSALQIALFVAPVLIFASRLRENPMDLVFSTMEIVAVVVAVVIARMVAEDGESNWLEGAMLLMLYVILGLAFFYLPESRKHDGGKPPRAVIEIRSDIAEAVVRRVAV
jgi:Ca2+:H+ antiporter